MFFQLFQNPVGLVAHCNGVLVGHHATANNNVILIQRENSAKSLNNMAFWKGVGVSGTHSYKSPGARFAREDRNPGSCIDLSDLVEKYKDRNLSS